MKIICISGHAQHGKDTAALLIKSHMEAAGKKVMITHYADLLKYICKSFFAWNGKKDDAGRALLQHIGTDIVRTKNPNYWVEFLTGIIDLFGETWDYVLIPDCRFPNEIEDLIKHGFDVITIRITRPNYNNSLTPEQRSHPSETALDDYIFDYTIQNPGSLGEFNEVLASFVKEANL